MSANNQEPPSFSHESTENHEQPQHEANRPHISLPLIGKMQDYSIARTQTRHDARFASGASILRTPTADSRDSSYEPFGQSPSPGYTPSSRSVSLPIELSPRFEIPDMCHRSPAATQGTSIHGALVHKPKYNIISEANGAKLCRLCEAVPYLLGPTYYVDVIRDFPDNPVDEEALLDGQGEPLINAQDLTSKDRAIINILLMTQTPKHERHDNHWLFSRINLENDKLLIFKYDGPFHPVLDRINLRDFTQMAATWKREANPDGVFQDGPNVITPWGTILPKLRERQIKTEDVDSDIYHELTEECEGQSLERALVKLKLWAEDGTLDHRKERHRQNELLRAELNASTYIKPQSRAGTEVYAKRYCHRYPAGRLMINGRNPERRTGLLEDPEETVIAMERNRLEELRGSRKDWATSRCGKVTKVIVLLTIACGGIAAVVVTCFRKLGRKVGDYDLGS